MSGPNERFEGDTSGQTLPDFAVGIAVFLITVTFVSVFVPQLVLPFDDQEQSVVVDRVTSSLSNEILTDRGTPSQLNESSTRTFFDRSENEALDQLGIPTWYSVNVTIRNAPPNSPDSEILCAVDDPGSDEWIDECADGDAGLTLGEPAVEDDGSVATGRQTLFAGDRDVVLEVRVW
ncbi:MAG: DUF7287 family protein [Halobacteriota archaeon]